VCGSLNLDNILGVEGIAGNGRTKNENRKIDK